MLIILHAILAILAGSCANESLLYYMTGNAEKAAFNLGSLVTILILLQRQGGERNGSVH